MKNNRVLVVDDERGFLQIVQIILQRAGYEPILAGNAAEARLRIASHRPDALILDDDMPGTTGGELCLELKQNPNTRHIAVVMFSANERIRNEKYLSQIMADAAVKKPCMPADILNALETSLKATATV
ncbi:MAG: response regulator [Chloroflexota bacterium]